jgi:hypothetical protein
MKLPRKVTEKIEAVEKKEMDRYGAERRRQQLESERRRRLQDEKLARYDEVWGNARFLDGWRVEFLQAPETERIWRIVGPEGRLPIFAAKFWLGEPCPPNDRTCWAALVLDGWCHHFRYEEWHKGRRSFRSERLTGCQEIFDALHPDLLKQLREFLSGPDAWKYVIQELDRLGA